MRQNLGYQGANFLRQSSYYSLYSLFIIYSNSCIIGVNYLLSTQILVLLE
jgi:hypothetical protein